MRQYPIYEEYQYEGALAEVCADYVAEKRALGCAFNTKAKNLREFSRMSLAYELSANTLTEEVVAAWLKRRPNDADSTVYQRFAMIKGLSEYMLRMGYKAYLPLSSDIPKLNLHGYVPYIFTYSEVLGFFAAADTMQSMSNHKRVTMPVIFRLLYCCGLRVSEVVNLTSDCVDFNNGTLTILNSKHEKSRYVPMSEEMVETLMEYASKNPHEPHFFSSSDGTAYSESYVYKVFRQTLFSAGISHGGRGKGPRLHDFRHTFAVHCLQKWVLDGVPLSSALPRLSAYLGHNDLAATEKYLRMTAEVYPAIAELLSKNYGHIIPKENRCD